MMSHVAIVQVEIKDLGALKAACADLGLSFMEDQKTYAWFGRSVGDYPLPDGFSERDLGHCEHAISLGDGRHPHAYEIGVVPRRDGKPGWTLLWDFFMGGYGLEEVIGDGTKNLIDRYAVNVVKWQALKLGYACQEFAKADVSVDVVLTKKAGR